MKEKHGDEVGATRQETGEEGVELAYERAAQRLRDAESGVAPLAQAPFYCAFCDTYGYHPTKECNYPYPKTIIVGRTPPFTDTDPDI